MNKLTPPERRALRAKAHHLDPVVLIGQHGLTPGVLHEIDLALTAHELIKVRVFQDDRAARAGLGERICAELDCATVQHLGKLLILWRPKPEELAEKVAPAAAPRSRVPSAAAHERRRRATGRSVTATLQPRSGRRPPKGKPLAVRSPKAPAAPFAGGHPPRTKAQSTPKRPGTGAPTRPDVRFAPRGPGRKLQGTPSATARASTTNSRRRRGRSV